MSDPSRVYVVPSAPGKRFSGDEKVTDLLYRMYYKASKDEDFGEELDEIKARYQEIIDGLGLEGFSLEGEFAQIERKMHHEPRSNYAASRGEYLNGRIMARYLGYEFIDAKDVIFFDDQGNLDSEKTNKVLRECLENNPKAVIPGFYGRGADGHVKTFSRGGSDITGSIVARACRADVYENWTDVSGFLSADPRIVKNPRAIRRITFDEMRELSYMGASVLHEDSIFPVREASIPIQIKNTNDPDAKGTTIRETAEDDEDEHLITGVAGMKGYLSIYISKNNLSRERGIVARALRIFERYNCNIEHIPTGIDSFCVVIRADEIGNAVYSLVADLKEELDADEVEITEGLALISVVSRNMGYRAGVSGRIFSALGDANINIRMISQSSQEITIILGVSEEDFEDAIRVIYERLVANEMVDVSEFTSSKKRKEA